MVFSFQMWGFVRQAIVCWRGEWKALVWFAGVFESSWIKLKGIYKTVDKLKYIYQWLVITPVRGAWCAESWLAQVGEYGRLWRNGRVSAMARPSQSTAKWLKQLYSDGCCEIIDAILAAAFSRGTARYTSARAASDAWFVLLILTLNSIIQLARRHYRWWQNAKKRMETFVSMRK